ncbi:MAG: hypothetical protein R3D44_03420 [Hyphomicrobiaceae bacterium]
MQPTENERPVFLLGTGRCGSTYQQVRISQIADIWIWGEHDGILEDLFKWAELGRSNPTLGGAFLCE